MSPSLVPATRSGVSRKVLPGRRVCEVSSRPARSHLAAPASPGDREYIRDLKERCCYVAVHFDEEKEAAHARKYQLPDGREIELGQERFLCPEALFQTDLVGEPGGQG